MGGGHEARLDTWGRKEGGGRAVGQHYPMVGTLIWFCDSIHTGCYIAQPILASGKEGKWEEGDLRSAL